MPKAASKNKKSFYDRNFFLIAIALVFLLPFVRLGLRRAIDSNNNELADWLPSSYAESHELRWFQQHFVGEQFALVSWEGCTLGNTKALELLAEKVAPSDGRPTDASRLFKSAMTGPSVLADLTSPPLSLSYQDAIRRLEGSLVGPKVEGEGDESRTTCLVVTLSDEGKQNNRRKREALQAIEVAASQCSIPPTVLKMGGPPVDNVSIDVEGERTLYRLAGLSGLVGICLAYLCFRSFRLTLMVLAVGGISAGISMAIVAYFGMFEVLVQGLTAPRFGTFDAILMSMPAVVYVLGLSGAIHIINYYHDAVEEQGLRGAVESAVRHGWKPCTIAALTTALGLVSLYTSDITPIRKFGVYTAIGVLATLGLLFTLLPICLVKFAPRRPRRKPDSTDSNGGKGTARAPKGQNHPQIAALFGRVSHFITDRNGIVGAAMFCLMLFMAIGLTRIETTVQLLKLFDKNADIIHDYRWLEDHLGNLVPMEVVVKVDTDRCRQGSEDPEADGQRYRLDMLERMEMTARVQRRIEALDGVGRALSAATFAPETDLGRTALSTALGLDPRKVLASRMEKHRDVLLSGDYLRDEPSGVDPNGVGHHGPRELWRVSARLAALADVDYGYFVSDIRGVVDPLLAGYGQRDEILRQLHDSGRRLERAQICIVHGNRPAENGADEEPQQENQPQQVSDAARLLHELLSEAGAEVKLFSLQRLSLADDPTARQQVVQQVREALAQQDCVVLAPELPTDGTSSIDPALLASAAPVVVDLTGNLSGDDDLLTASASMTAEPPAAVYTGLVPLVYKTQRQLLTSLRKSIGWAFVLIAIVMMMVLGSAPAGMVAMIPNVFPIVMIFGAMGWLGIKVDIGTMMAASVALGVAVDDTVHFLTWFRTGLDQGLDRVGATHLAYSRCAAAMLQTTIVGGIGLSMFAFSSFTPTQQFGVLMVTLLSAALVGDLIFLPAILSGPVGRFFCGRVQEKAAARQAQQTVPAEQPLRPARVGEQPFARPGIRRDEAHRPIRT